VKTRAATGVDDFGSRLTASPLNVAVKALLSSLTAKANSTSLLNVGASPNAASLFPTSLPPPFTSQVENDSQPATP
jgi:hypothetical protein